MVLDRFSPAVREWFATTFSEPTAAQTKGWPAIADGDHTLILAPTGSGKTLAAFLWAIDRLVTQPPDPDARTTKVLYLSPLRALAVDVEKNLRSPLRGIALAAERRGEPVYEPTVGLRSGDTPTDERRRLVRHPPDILITTPESLFLMLTSKARETLRGVEHVIIDEIHALAPTKRGTHMALSLERLEELCDRPPQRIGLSATQRPLDEIARFLGGHDGARHRPVTIVDAGVTKTLDVEIVVPVDDMGALGEGSGGDEGGPERRSIWPAIHPRLLELIDGHASTLIFVNARRLAERLASRLNELAFEQAQEQNRALEQAEDGIDPSAVVPEVVRAHHGSLSRDRRLQIEDDLKRGELKAIVCTSSLELGIDMGAVDLVIQVESPGAVSRGLQRIGRAGHQVGQASRGRIFPKHRIDLVEAAVVLDGMQHGRIESTRYPRNPLDVLSQHIVAMCAMDDWPVDGLASLIRRAAPYVELSDDVFRNVLDLLAGRYPSEEFSELRPRVVWDRVADVVAGRPGAQRLAVISGGTIPDRGLFGVFLPDGTRVGELDEEMVYESRPGETFLLGASSWRIEEITFERVIVTPAPGEPGRMPFWHGDGPGRPAELGQAMGAFVRRVRDQRDDAWLVDEVGLDGRAAANLRSFIDEQAEATGVVPDDRTIVVERFRDEIGDWRVCVLSPFGAQIHAPWAMALQARLGERWGSEPEMIWSDDGIVLRLPESIDEVPLDDLLLDPADIDQLVIAHLPNTAMFAARFRECAARALLLPRRRPDQRTPLWQQRQRAADLLRVAANYPDFPVLLETTRECCNDVFDLPALRTLLSDLQSRKVRAVAVDTDRASPFAQSLLFSWIATYMYEGDAPLAERRAAALALDRDLLRELLGSEELRELLDAEVLVELELELQFLTDERRVHDAEGVADLLRRIGPLSLLDVTARVDGDGAAMSTSLIEARRVIEVAIAGETRLAVAEDAGRLRDALGVALPVGLPAAFTDPVATPLRDLVLRYACSHGPFVIDPLAAWLGGEVPNLRVTVEQLALDGLLVHGEFRPNGVEREWCDPEVLRRLRRRSLAALRREVEPVDTDALVRFLAVWQGVGGRRRGVDALAETIGVLQGAPLVASTLENDVLASRIDGYESSMLDQLASMGDVVWLGSGSIGARDGRIRLVFRDQVRLFVAAPGDDRPDDALHEVIRSQLAERGASFFTEIQAAASAAGLAYQSEAVVAALWDLVWAGEVTNDTLAPVRALAMRGGRGAKSRTARARRPGRLTSSGPPTAVGRWSLVSTLVGAPATPTEMAHARAVQLLERYGVLTREMALGEGATGGFAGVYPILRALEEQGKVRRGYFVAGLGAAQFALPGAVDRLRDHRETADSAPALVLAATDPAQPFGAAVPWPDTEHRPSRSAGAYVVIDDGRAVAFLERGGRSAVVLDGDADPAVWIGALSGLVASGRVSKLEIAKIDGESSGASPLVPAFESAGFSRGYRGLLLRHVRR